MNLNFLNSIFSKKINKYIDIDIEKLFEILEKNKNAIYELTFLSLFLLILYFLINSIFINPLFKILSKNKKSNLDRLKTIIRGLKNLISLALIFIFIFTLLNQFGIKITVLLTSAGILGATLLVIFQNSIRDFLSGWFFVIEDAFREGEYIMVNNTFKGRVDNLKSRYLVLRGDNGELIMIPYGQINFVHNFSRKRIINRILLKIKRESYNEETVNNFKKFIEDIPQRFPEIAEVEIIENTEFSENYVEFIIKFKTAFSLKDISKSKLKKELFSTFNEIILEIKDAS